MDSFIEALIKAGEDYRAFSSSFKHARASMEACRAFLTLKQRRPWQLGEHVAFDSFDVFLCLACSVGLAVIIFMIWLIFMPNFLHDPEEDKMPFLLLIYLPILLPLIMLTAGKPLLKVIFVGILALGLLLLVLWWFFLSSETRPP